MTYRTGNHQPQNLYRGDQYIGVMFDPADAALIVDVMEGRADTPYVDHTRGAAKALATVLGVLDGWIEGAKADHEGNGHRGELVGEECWTQFHPEDIRRMVADAAIEMGVDEDARVSASLSPLAAENASGVPASTPSDPGPAEGAPGGFEMAPTFEVYGLGNDEFGAVVLKCLRCPWQAEVETTDDTLTLADLNQRADEHGEVCR